jgi:hypothetical protein
VNWSPSGSEILVLGTQNGGNNFGLLEYHSTVAFSAQAATWSRVTPVTSDATANHGVVAGAFSPRGKSIALISNLATNVSDLYIVPSGDFALKGAQPVLTNACQVSWQSDGKELAVMQPYNGCGSGSIGTIVAVNPAQPAATTTLATQAAHPAWQPVTSGG